MLYRNMKKNHDNAGGKKKKKIDDVITLGPGSPYAKDNLETNRHSLDPDLGITGSRNYSY